MSEITTKIKVADYGDMVSQIKGMELVAYQTYGSYQGKYLVVLNDNGVYKFFMDFYGSCSGCDWLASEKDWDTGEVDYKDALDYCNQIVMKYAIPEKMWRTLTNEQKELLVDDDFYESEEMKQEIVKF